MLNLPDANDESRAVGVTLPPRRAGHAVSGTQYGVYEVAASYCGFPVPPAPFRGEWQHGWHPPDRNYDPEAVVGSDGLSRHRKDTHTFLVAREDQRAFLESEGYRSVHSVGLPIIYQPTPSVQRAHGSLLVMPVHSADYNTLETNFSKYAAEIASIRDRFSQVAVCINGADFRRGYWIDAFAEYDISIVSGADYFDANSYARLAMLFSRFEFMTTNGDGSHIAYAALYGARPSLYGAIVERSARGFSRDVLYGNNPELLERGLESASLTAMQLRVKPLFVDPWEATDQRDWASFQLGMDCKRTPEDLSQILGWRAPGRGASTVRTATRAIARSARSALNRAQNPDLYSQTKLLALLKRSPPGTRVETTRYWANLETNNGPRMAWELDAYFFGKTCAVRVNPPDAPAIDLAPGEGISVLGLAKRHPNRTVYYLPYPTADGQRLSRNLRTKSELASRTEALTVQQPVGAPAEIFAPESWPALRSCNRGILSAAAVLKLAIKSSGWADAVEALDDFPRCRLLILECQEEPQRYLGPLLTKLSEIGFTPHLDHIKVGAFGEPGRLLAQHVLVLAFTRSGMDLPQERPAR